jgi:ferredoxin-type protein NapH
MMLTIIRRVVLALAFVLISVGLILNTGTGTLSSLGWQAIASICPLGAVESIVASKTIFPRALIVLGLTIVLIIVFGKAFCSWICPVAPVRGLFFFFDKKRREKGRTRASSGAEAALVPAKAEEIAAPAKAEDAVAPVGAEEIAALTKAESGSLSTKSCGSCTACAEKRAKLDSRHLILGGSLLSAAIFGFPVFCLICPIGLTFGTIIVVWQWFNYDNVTLSLLVYPAILIIELFVLRKWCAKFCPLGALLSLMSLPNRLFRPKVNRSRCLREQGLDCTVCLESCPEGLDPHYKDGMNECSKCGLCKQNCPATAISIPLLNR